MNRQLSLNTNWMQGLCEPTLPYSSAGEKSLFCLGSTDHTVVPGMLLAPEAIIRNSLHIHFSAREVPTAPGVHD